MKLSGLVVHAEKAHLGVRHKSPVPSPERLVHGHEPVSSGQLRSQSHLQRVSRRHALAIETEIYYARHLGRARGMGQMANVNVVVSGQAEK